MLCAALQRVALQISLTPTLCIVVVSSKLKWSDWYLYVVPVMGMLSAGHACAASVDAQIFKKDEPALLIAKEVHYDDQNATATAVGDVEVVQGETILRADKVIYNVNEDKVLALGHVSMLEPSGDVFFADNVELKQKMQKGVVNQFKARFKDDTLFAARQGQRINKDITHLKKLVYSPCKVCETKEGEKGKAPLWQIEASKAVIDEEKKRVTYRNAFFDVYGVPVFYTPYFSHPTPDAPSQSGILTPQYFHATDLGSVAKLPVFISIAPDMDMTLTPWYLSKEKPLLAGEFRKLFEHGNFRFNGAITNTYNRDSSGSVIPGDQVRGYAEAHGLYNLTPKWTVGLDAERTTDDTFLQLYRFGWKDMLTSRLYGERIDNRNYTMVEALSFQGLTPLDRSSLSPTILPSAVNHFETAPQIWNSRVMVDSSLLMAQQSEGVSTRRISTTAGWKIPYITRGGQVFETTMSLRADGYDVSDQWLDAAHNSYSGSLGRVIPQWDFNWRYPVVKKWGSERSLMIAPVAELTLSPTRILSPKYPNSDSQVAELSDMNLFSPNRFTGLDQVESGSRITYGTRGLYRNNHEEWLEWLVGQTYQQNDHDGFPITKTNDPHYSDYVGRLGVKYHWVDLAYSFRLDRVSLNPIKSNVNMLFDWEPVKMDISYASLRNDAVFGNRNEIFGNASWDMTQEWRVAVNGRRDLGSSERATVTSAPTQDFNPLQPQPGTVGLGSSLVYHNECLMVTTSIGRNYISQQDVKPSTTMGVMIVLNKMSGGKNTNNMPPPVTGAGNVESSQMPYTTSVSHDTAPEEQGGTRQ